jgi:carbamoyltransferase
MPQSGETTYLGLGKTLFNSNVALIEKASGRPEIELLLTERLAQQKASGVWPEKALEELKSRHDLSQCLIGENRDVVHPAQIETYLNQRFPFFEVLKSKHLEMFSSHFNPKVTWIPHHLCHAWAGALMSPYKKALILVMDGAGSRLDDFTEAESNEKNHLPKNYIPTERYLEESSCYCFDSGKLFCIDKEWQVFWKNEDAQDEWLSAGLGSVYEKTAEYIFNDKRAAGKVMGLAAYGRSLDFKEPLSFLATLDWSLAFKDRGKEAWENFGKFSIYADIAATIQSYFERKFLDRVIGLKKKYPTYENLILMGGCALNCTNNMKLFQLGLFDSIYTPPFPGDESIGLGLATYLYRSQQGNSWTPLAWDQQHGYFGSPSSVPYEEEILKEFSEFNIIKPDSIEDYAAKKIAAGAIIGWFQGRSETGPRALGNRSILARADKPGLKNHLNSAIKKREDFRPYGCSVPHNMAHIYFDVPRGFENPFMAFAVHTRSSHSSVLRQVTHLDGTSRMQTVRPTQNPRFYRLLQEVGNLTGVFCLLNTSLNVMGAPIVESIKDARLFLAQTPVDGLAIGDFYITRN